MAMSKPSYHFIVREPASISIQYDGGIKLLVVTLITCCDDLNKCQYEDHISF